MEKKRWLFVLTFLGMMPFALADITDTLGNVGRSIVGLWSLGFLGVGSDIMVVAFTRMLIWLLLFTLFFAVITGLGGDKGFAPMKFFNRGQAGIIAAVVATIGVLFMPANILGAVGGGWATAISLLLIGGPIVGLAYLLWKIPGKDSHGNSRETKWTVFLKIVLCFLLLWILSVMKFHVGRLGFP